MTCVGSSALTYCALSVSLAFSLSRTKLIKNHTAITLIACDMYVGDRNARFTHPLLQDVII